MLWAAQFTGPRLGGLLWALATWMKWVPVVFWPILPGRAKHWGLFWLAVSVGLSVADAAADDHPAPGAVRVRGAAGPARLPRLPVGRRPVALPQGRPVRLPAAGDLARAGWPTATRRRLAPAGAGLIGAGSVAVADHRRVLAPALVDRPQEQRPEHVTGTTPSTAPPRTEPVSPCRRRGR